MKNIHVTFQFDEEHWKDLIKYYKATEIRQILYEGGMGELGELISNRKKEERDKT